MLSHQPEVIRLIHLEHSERLRDDTQQPLQSVSLPSHGLARVFPRLGALAHVALTPRRRGAYSKP